MSIPVRPSFPQRRGKLATERSQWRKAAGFSAGARKNAPGAGALPILIRGSGSREQMAELVRDLTHSRTGSSSASFCFHFAACCGVSPAKQRSCYTTSTGCVVIQMSNCRKRVLSRPLSSTKKR
jgi:hypothetical protein